MAQRVGVPSPAAQKAVVAFRAEYRGRLTEIANELGISKQALCGWRVIPAEWVRQLSALTGIPAWRLRPDLYDPPHPEAAAAAGRAP